LGLVLTLERRGKRLLTRLLAAVVRTPARTRDEIFGRAPQRILLIRQQNQMGDMLLAVPAFRAVRETFPEAKIGLVAAPINQAVLLNNPYIDEVFNYTSRRWLSIVSMIREIRRRRFDVVIVLHTVSFSFTSAALGLLSGARFRVGSTSEPFGHRLSRSFYHFELPLPSPDELAVMNEAEHNLYPLRAAGIDTPDLAPLIVPTDGNRRWAVEFLGEPRVAGAARLVIHPGAGKAANIWPQERFADAVNRIAAAVPLDLTVIEGPRDAAAVAAVCADIATPARVLRGRPIGDVAAVMQKADVVLCNDTGVMHVACAAGARTLAIFGPTDPRRWAPRCVNLTIVRAEGGDLRRLTAETVSARALELLDAASRKG